MGEKIYGLANILNFSVKDQFIIWEKYTIAINSISVFSTGVSTNYTKEKKEKNAFGKTVKLFGAIFTTVAQIADEDAPDKIETLETAWNLYGSESDLPCMNLVLSNGVTMEITFTDLMTFRDNVKAVRQKLAESAKQQELKVQGTDIVVNAAEFNGDSYFIEGGKG